MDINIEFTGEIWYWRGPAPFFFISVPKSDAEVLKSVSAAVSYGWGMIPVNVRIGSTKFKTALFAKDGTYVVPVKASVRAAEKLETGDVVKLELSINF